MKIVRCLFLLVLAAVLASAPALAGQGAYVVRNEVDYLAFAFAPSEMGRDVLVIGSPTSPRPIWCDATPSQVLYTDWMTVVRPSEAVHVNAHGKFFTWVYYGVRDQDLVGKLGSDRWWDGLCKFMDTHTPDAEGITNWFYTDSDVTGAGPGAFSYGAHIAGTLIEKTITCGSGMLDFVAGFRASISPTSDYPACWPGCQIIHSDVGPLLTCVE